jgi:hypothetical protein
MHSLRVGIPSQPRLSKLPANSTLLHASKRHPEIPVIARVDPYHARLQLPRNTMRALDVLRENSRAQAVDRVVGHLDSLLLSLERCNDHEGSEDLLFVDVHFGLDIREDSGLDEVSLSVADVSEALSTTDQLCALVLSGLGEAENALVLYLGDLRALAGGCGEGVADDLDLGDVFGEVGDKFVVDALLNENAGCGAADLALVVEDADVLWMLVCGEFAQRRRINLQPI